MMYAVIVKDGAEYGIEKHKKAGQKILLRKINDFLDEVEKNPETGTGNPEHLKYLEEDGVEIWSRRINQKHRFIYSIDEENKIVEILSVWGHYGDK